MVQSLAIPTTTRSSDCEQDSLEGVGSVPKIFLSSKIFIEIVKRHYLTTLPNVEKKFRAEEFKILRERGTPSHVPFLFKMIDTSIKWLVV